MKKEVDKLEGIEHFANEISKRDSCLDSIETKLLIVFALSISLFGGYIIQTVTWSIPNQQPQIILLSLVVIAIVWQLRSINNRVKEFAYQ